jgi:mycofactocin system glycosyltransferase
MMVVGKGSGAPSSGLPDGFTVRIGRQTRVLDQGAVLIGGTNSRVVRLTPKARAMVSEGAVTVGDAASRKLAEYLLENGFAHPAPDGLPEIELDRLTVVIPAKDRARLLARLLDSIPDAVAGVIVVDDGSDDAAAIARAAAAAGARLLVHPRNLGVSAARNSGMRAVTTEFVAFIDTDVVLDEACLPLLLRHFADPRLALAAPRVVGTTEGDPTWITRYEDARSSLDLGIDSAPVVPRTRVAWVPTTCVVARVALLGDGFDESTRAGEDVDLVWRLHAAGHRIRYEPAAVVHHEHRARAERWLGRKFFYGTGAQPLAARHPANVAPVVLAPWSAVVLVAALAQRRWSVPVIVGTAGFVTWRIALRIGHLRHPYRVSVQLVAGALVSATAQAIALLVRHWWPLAVVGAVFSRRVRRAVAVAAVADAVWEYARLRPNLDPLRFGLAKRLDDLAYGAGVWWSSLRAGSVRALLPAVVRVTRHR